MALARVVALARLLRPLRMLGRAEESEEYCDVIPLEGVAEEEEEKEEVEREVYVVPLRRVDAEGRSALYLRDGKGRAHKRSVGRERCAAMGAGRDNCAGPLTPRGTARTAARHKPVPDLHRGGRRQLGRTRCRQANAARGVGRDGRCAAADAVELREQLLDVGERGGDPALEAAELAPQLCAARRGAGTVEFPRLFPTCPTKPNRTKLRGTVGAD